MSLNDQITELLKLGCTKVTFGMTQEGAVCIGAEQHFPSEKGLTHAVHETQGTSPVDVATKVLAAVRHVHELKVELSGLVTLPRQNGRV